MLEDIKDRNEVGSYDLICSAPKGERSRSTPSYLERLEILERKRAKLISRISHLEEKVAILEKTNKSKYRCPYCGKEFKTEEGKIQHMKAKHAIQMRS